MKSLASVLSRVHVLEQSRNLADINISDIAIDSRLVKDNTFFVAMRGLATDGHTYIDKAVEQGAVAILCEELPSEAIQAKVCCVRVANTADALGLAASEFFDNPSHQMIVIGVTGTNGKTTTTTLLADLYEALGYKVGLIGTVANRVAGQVQISEFTTPDAVQLQKLLNGMHQAGCQYVFMEVSSHAIAQRRIAGLKFTGVAFTNLTHDHLDYHGTFANYLAAKKNLFDEVSPQSFALTNIDDKNGLVMLQNCKGKHLTYSLKRAADNKGRLLSNTLEGLLLEINGIKANFVLTGEFNAYNLLLVYGVAVQLGEKPQRVLELLSASHGAKGRFERIISPNKIFGIVDYAHTPDALENVLQTIKKGKSSSQRIFTVVGCGGNRDKTKRPIMAKIAAQMSHKAILTSDNPRMEEPSQILKDMQEGLTDELKVQTLVIENRREAIQKAVSLACPYDIILVAGKGHENYQDIGGTKHFFDDLEELKQCFAL
ncbi:MAG: UDP-N-acetylmuramoyl-L-alanyl-D-glutamate--2,6-diaminopimelate ligase [Cytophagales bacterium]|nr:MAG: UDP-N-acetylmuramoyl-L-alanyl-D-glutamate--2,6-diaminopimelate ligase [Cytophagales bacterium]TAF59235.1 MAG: UDP-N-acetylmuramoyl-L-alanyl-D-glutamate--2,6-diaminopimelate ligase [Cytophagales bacterium]